MKIKQFDLNNPKQRDEFNRILKRLDKKFNRSGIQPVPRSAWLETI